MKRLSRFLVRLSCVVLLLGSAARLESQELPKVVSPGFSGCSPAVFIPLEAAMTVKISDIGYADTGMMVSFREEIAYARRDPILLTVTVILAKWTGDCSSLEYSVEGAGTTLTSPPLYGWDASKLPQTVAFPPRANAGILIGGGPLQADLTTDLGYDEMGRRYIRRQVFTNDRMTYEVAYSGYGYAPGGTITSFTARIRPQVK